MAMGQLSLTFSCDFIIVSTPFKDDFKCTETIYIQHSSFDDVNPKGVINDHFDDPVTVTS